MATCVTLAVLDSIGSICICYVAFRYAFELMDEIWSLIPAIVFENILRLLVHSQKTRYLPERASCLQICVCQCLIVGLLLGFIEHLLRFVLSIKLYKSFLHELFPHFLCLRHQASLDDITHVAKSVGSGRRGLCGVKWGSMNQLSNI